VSSFSFERAPAQQEERICVAYDEFCYVPLEKIWLIAGPAGSDANERVVVRVRRYNFESIVEIASRSKELATAILRQLAADALEHSIFRGQFIEVRYGVSPHRDHGFQNQSAEMTVTFKPKLSLRADEIILEPNMESILRRNMFDFHAHRDELFALGIPRKRALLFYGPPGTGKTHTCRFIHSMLKGITTILAAGESLTRLEDLGQLARQLQPTLVILEDVDLVFHSRELSPYGTALGDLMDHLDSFTTDEDVIFVLTTNAIERVEAAIRDRPGRINQCLFFGMPNPELRRRYLLQYLKPYDVRGVDFDQLVAETEGTSQAFMKEYVLRAVHVAAQAGGYPQNGVLLRTEHFNTGFEELTSHGNPAGHSIMGFRTRAGGFGIDGQS
jgi:hypothetical protein